MFLTMQTGGKNEIIKVAFAYFGINRSFKLGTNWNS